MGELSMEELVESCLETIRHALRANGSTVQDWYDDGMLIGELTGALTSEVETNDVLVAWGYLTGVADALDMTVLEMVWHYGLAFDTVRGTPQRRKGGGR